RYKEITAAWERGDEVRGWALYWDMLYRFVHKQLEATPELKEHAMTVRFEQLCAEPEETIRAVLGHSILQDDELVESWAPLIRTPDYYQSDLTAAEIALIKNITGETAQLFGY